VTTSVGVLTYFKTVNVDYVSPVLYAYERFILTMNYLHTSRTPYFRSPGIVLKLENGNPDDCVF